MGSNTVDAVLGAIVGAVETRQLAHACAALFLAAPISLRPRAAALFLAAPTSLHRGGATSARGTLRVKHGFGGRRETMASSVGAQRSDVTILLNHIDPRHPEQSVPSVGDSAPWPTRGFVEKWLHEHEAATQRREGRMLRWTVAGAVAAIIAAIAGVIAAWPVIKG